MSVNDYWSQLFEERIVLPPLAFEHYKIFVYAQHDIETGEPLGTYGAYAEPFEQPYPKAALSPFHIVGKASKEQALDEAQLAVHEAVNTTERRNRFSKRPLLNIKQEVDEIVDYKCYKIMISRNTNSGKYDVFCKPVEQPFFNEMAQSVVVTKKETISDAIQSAKSKIDYEIEKTKRHDQAGGIDNIPY